MGLKYDVSTNKLPIDLNKAPEITELFAQISKSKRKPLEWVKINMKNIIFSHSSVLAAIVKYLILSLLTHNGKTNFCSKWVFMIQRKADKKKNPKHYVPGRLVKISFIVCFVFAHSDIALDINSYFSESKS